MSDGDNFKVDLESGQNIMYKVLNFLFLLKVVFASAVVVGVYHILQILTSIETMYWFTQFTKLTSNLVWCFMSFKVFVYVFTIYKYCTYLMTSLTNLSDGKRYVDEQFREELERQTKIHIDNE